MAWFVFVCVVSVVVWFGFGVVRLDVPWFVFVCDGLVCVRFASVILFVACCRLCCVRCSFCLCRFV